MRFDRARFVPQLLYAPNQLTLLRMVFLPFIVINLIDEKYGWALGLFVLAGLSDGLDGLLIEDPRDLEACAVAFGRLLDEPDLASRLGRSARARVLAEFVGDRHLEQYADLLDRLVAATDA